MSGINLGKIIAVKRKEKGLTQDALASYMGVSKASVSKWETGQSYPDITLLPQLATYFNVSIDELMGYSPQLTKEAIRKYYRELAADFAEQPFEHVYLKWKELVQKYYSCFPFLQQMALLMLNHESLQKDPQRKPEIYEEIRALFARVREEAREGHLIQQAGVMEALCDLTLGNHVHAIALLEPFQEPRIEGEVILASAYYTSGDLELARQTTQMGIYQNISGLIGVMSHYLNYFQQDREGYEEVVTRLLGICEMFHMETLSPGVMLNTYFAIAVGYAVQNEGEKCLDILRKYTELNLSGIYPLTLKNEDAFFDQWEACLERLDFDVHPPRDNETIKRDIVAQMDHPVFAGLQEHPGFLSLKERLKHGLLGSTDT